MMFFRSFLFENASRSKSYRCSFSSAPYCPPKLKTKFIPRVSGATIPNGYQTSTKTLRSRFFWQKEETTAAMANYQKNLEKKGILRMIAWMCVLSSLAGVLPLIYRAVCLQQEGVLSNEGNHKAVAPQMSDDDATKRRLIQVDFDACVLGNLKWDFRASQKRIVVTPGESALAFFTAENQAEKPVLGYAIYTVIPPEMGVYFNKVQCFCFEEQLLSPGELVDLPVLFYIDPEVAYDSRLFHVDRCTLTYVFYETFNQIPEEYLTIPHIREQLQTQGKLPSPIQISELESELEHVE